METEENKKSLNHKKRKRQRETLPKRNKVKNLSKHVKQLSVKRYLECVSTCKILVPVREIRFDRKFPTNIPLVRFYYLYHGEEVSVPVETNGVISHLYHKGRIRLTSV